MSKFNVDSFDVVTGGAGFIGSHLTDALLASGRNVRVIDNLSVGRLKNLEQHKDHPNLDIQVEDVSNCHKMLELTKGADRVFHLAALADIVPSIQKPEAYFRSNVDGTFSILQAIKENNVKRLVYIASSSCYGIPEVYPTPETASPSPQYPYALTKWIGESLVSHWAQIYNVSAISLRFFNIYGPRARTSGTYGAVFGVFLAQLLANKPLTVVGDGKQTRDFTYVSDAVNAIMTSGDSCIKGIYNVGSDTTVSVNKLIELLNPASGIVHIPKRPGEPDCTFADITAIKEDLGWLPKVNIEEGVQKLLENIEYWKDAPVWDPESISVATKDWFKYLSS